jgi:hypothetical protein
VGYDFLTSRESKMMNRVLVLSFLMFGLTMLSMNCASEINDLDGANEELHLVRTAIQACLADADTTQLDSAVSAWDGRLGKATATSENDTVYDAGIYIQDMVFRATYDISHEGLVIAAHNVSWKGVEFDATYPQVSHWVKSP